MAASETPEKIDRFIVNEVLGQGAQAIVYLARDPDLGRQVAIKSVYVQGSLERSNNVEQLLSEARTVSRLQHANIVTIYDLGIADQNPFLVLEYIDGNSLVESIHRGLSIEQCIRVIRDVLSGVSAAHKQDIIHCDIKPANILIHTSGQAKVADFGLAQLADVNRKDESALYGTPQYMAPEYIESRRHQTVSDVFSLGLVFYEMLTGKNPFKGKDIYQILNLIANVNIAAPSSLNPAVDDGMDALIMKALEKDPDKRFSNAGAMLKAFNDYLSLSGTEINDNSSSSTVSFLLRRMRHKKDFPAFSQTISALNRASSSETESLTSVSNTILKDYSLTNKVLRLVNSAHYNRGGGKISTISRAVVMLGINTVRNIASALMLFEHLQNKSQARQFKEDAVQALFSALLANEMAATRMKTSHEEAFLCAMLQQLGKMLVRYYLHEESQAIDKLVATQECSEAMAVSQILGTSYQQLGMAVAHEWGFPEPVIESMRLLDFNHLPEAASETISLQLISQFSNALGDTLTLPQEQQPAALALLNQQFSKALKINDDKVDKMIESCRKELKVFAKTIQFDLSRTRFYEQLAEEEVDEQEQSSSTTDSKHSAQQKDENDGVEILEENTEEQQKNSEKALSDGIQDIVNTLTGDCTINQVMQMILETIYRAIPGSRVALCLKDNKTASIRARFGYGDDIESIVNHLSIPLAYRPDVFHIAFTKNVDIRIENTQDEKIRSKIPDWYHQNIGARSFTIFPIIIKEAPIALIYIDTADKQPIEITDSQLGLLKTLRNQAILAIKTIR